jgi:hypothetical protein
MTKKMESNKIKNEDNLNKKRKTTSTKNGRQPKKNGNG